MRPLIADLKPGDASGYGLLLSVEPRLTKKGQRFASGEIGDMSGVLAVVDWSGSGLTANALKPYPSFVAWAGAVGEYDGAPQLKLEEIRPVRESDRALGFDEARCVPAIGPPSLIDALWRELSVLLGVNLGADALAIAEAFLASETGQRLKIWPAAERVHHAKRGGLLLHVLKMARGAVAIAPVWDLDLDVLLLGVLFHDAGKLETLQEMPGARPVALAALEGHIQRGLEIFETAAVAAALGSAGEPLCSRVRHLILSHHGRKHFGSPVEPAIPEAWALHVLDMLDSKVERMREMTKGREAGEVVDLGWGHGRAVVVGEKREDWREELPDPVDGDKVP